MSADNWTTCPKCLVIAKRKTDQAMREAHDSYGKVPADEYHRLLKSASKLAEDKMKNTLREDYEIGVESNGEFFVSYSCSCQQCGFKFEYRHKQQVNVEGPARRT